MAASFGRRQALRAVLVALPGAAWARTLSAAPALGPAPLRLPGAGGGAAATSGGTVGARVQASEASSAASRSPAHQALAGEPAASSVLPELRPGLRLGRCTVVQVGAVSAGAVPVVLRTPSGEQFAVDILRHDRSTPGVSRGGALAVYLNNNGSGRTASVEEHGLGAMALARWLALREAGGRPVPALLTLRQRLPLLASMQG